MIEDGNDDDVRHMSEQYDNVQSKAREAEEDSVRGEPPPPSYRSASNNANADGHVYDGQDIPMQDLSRS